MYYYAHNSYCIIFFFFLTIHVFVCSFKLNEGLIYLKMKKTNVKSRGQRSHLTLSPPPPPLIFSLQISAQFARKANCGSKERTLRADLFLDWDHVKLLAYTIFSSKCSKSVKIKCKMAKSDKVDLIFFYSRIEIKIECFNF